ncbi:Gfo/Idh/MocA family protein [Sphingomonas quercus]|uniref:Gfo/Idh/MocA family oxidoreductase n=1 Tax=Sphingomonas quercus TaxID=2842451 RepID=A0ABS6BGF2_9SPHN|nr:Gfo/Idh/MocA family oxidoreductase [Sphingomonas quercus]MBU3077369.1 Gfo/Idh/MocA family oxidoreductase [Sphingomonas quercus]
MAERPLRLGMAGGGPGAFIGPVHRMAARLDDRFAVVAGALSRSIGKSREQGARWGIAADRLYASAEEMIAAEAARDDGIEAIAITTPNASHAAITIAALRAGIAVICDKPMTATLAEAEAVAAVVAQTGVPFALTHAYTGYAMVREARARIAAGAIGPVRKVVAEYPQGWLSEPIEGTNAQAGWRTDPALAGAGGAIGDIGVHALQMAEYVSGLRVTELCAALSRVVPGRRLDDDCNVLLRFGRGVPGVLMASQISAGERNGIRVRVYGERGGFEWAQEVPDRLILRDADNSLRILHDGAPGLSDAARAATRLPPGHPEGLIEAFATLYRDFADAIGGVPGILDGRLPGITDGLRAMRFIELAVRSSETRRWLSFDGETL